MAILNQTDWKAINWYRAEFGYTQRDMMAGPVVRFRDSKGQIVDINIFDIRTKYDGLKKTKKIAA